MTFVDGAWRSVKSAFSIGNTLKRFLLWGFFGLTLGFTKLIAGWDAAGANGEGLLGFLTAFGSAVRYGLGIGHATIWDFIRDVFVNGASYIHAHAWGTIIVSAIFGIAVTGWWFQPVSWLVNVLDFKGKNDPGTDNAGNATSFFQRLGITIVLVLIVSVTVYYAGWSESIAGGGEEFKIETNETIVVEDNVTNITDESSGIINALDMLGGGGNETG